MITVLVRHDDLSEFNENNPILEENELVCCRLSPDSDSCIYKVGDGIHPFKELPQVTQISEISSLLFIHKSMYSIKPNTPFITRISIDLNPYKEK